MKNIPELPENIEKKEGTGANSGAAGNGPEGENRKKGGRKRTKAMRERDLVIIASLYLEKKTIPEIAVEINTYYYENHGFTLSLTSIRKDVEEIIKRWRESSLVDMDEAKAIELASIDKLEAVYWDAWYKSTGEKKSEFAETIELPDIESHDGRRSGKKKSRVSIKKEDRDGNPAFLQGIERCIRMRAELLNLLSSDSKKKQEEEKQNIIVYLPTNGREGMSENERNDYINAVIEGSFSD